MLVVGGGVGYWVCRLTVPMPFKEMRMACQKVNKEGDVKTVTQITLEKKGDKTSIKIVESEQHRPDVVHVSPVENDEADETELTELQKGILQDIQDALDRNDLRAVRRALSKFVANVEKGGLGGRVPKCMRQKAVSALGWFGKDAAVDLLEYVADPDEEVSTEAFDAFESALQDSEMSARDRATYLVKMSQALNEADKIDSLLNNHNDLPNSMKAQTVETILTKGTEQAKSTMTEQLEFYLDDDVKTVDDIHKWAAENPDEP